MSLQEVSANRCFGGTQLVYRHRSEALDCEMNFGLFLPPQAATGPVPLLVYLSGLTCTEQNVITKAGAQAACAQHGIALLCPDTSPRGPGVADDEGYDLGQGAGFYVDATQPPWAAHFRMREYVSRELLALVRAEFPLSERLSISGHSMGGHGALTIGLTVEGFRSISAFSPICAPTQCPWGQKAFTAYLGPDRAGWAEFDASELVRRGRGAGLPLLVDQGEADPFLAEQLRPELLESACREAGRELTLRRHAGYDHSYYFIATFMPEHVAFHAAQLHA